MSKKNRTRMTAASHGVNRVALRQLHSLTDSEIDRVARSRLGGDDGLTFGGKRDVFVALGYRKTLRVADYRMRYYRNAVAARVVECFPKASWRGGAELVENDDPTTETTFEKAWDALRLRLHPWQALLRTDILAGLGTYAGLVLGARGRSESPLPKAVKPEELLYFASYAEDELKVESYVESTADARFGLPEYYLLTRTGRSRATQQPRPTLNTDGTRIHWTRVIHIADGLLDDRCFGTPRLERVWNLCDDLEKVTGGGSEAFWQRAQQGLQLNVDPTVVLDEEDKRELIQQADEYLHGMRRMFRTRGTEVKMLGSDTANFDPNTKAILAQISAGANVPLRILTGTESGELASSQDRTNWAERVVDRRKEVCEPYVRQLVDRLIEYGYLPKPKSYDVDWPREADLTEEQRTTIAARMAVANQAQATGTGTILMTTDEIRDRYLNSPPLADVMDEDELADGGVLRLPDGTLAGGPGAGNGAPEPAVESVEETVSQTEVERKQTKSTKPKGQPRAAEVDATIEALRRRREMRVVPPAGHRTKVKTCLRHRTRQRYTRVA